MKTPRMRIIARTLQDFTYPEMVEFAKMVCSHAYRSSSQAPYLLLEWAAEVLAPDPDPKPYAVVPVVSGVVQPPPEQSTDALPDDAEVKF